VEIGPMPVGLFGIPLDGRQDRQELSVQFSD
jgi:hypothetical protein